MPHAHTLWNFIQSLIQGNLAGRAVFYEVSLQLQQHDKSLYLHEAHTNADTRYKPIRQAKITAANVNDGRTLIDVLARGDTGARVLLV